MWIEGSPKDDWELKLLEILLMFFSELTLRILETRKK